MKRKLDYFYACIIPNPVWERKKTAVIEKVEEHLIIVEQYHLPIFHETIFMTLHKSQIDPELENLDEDGLPGCHDAFRKTMAFQAERYVKDWYCYWANSNPVLNDYQLKRREERNKLKNDFENYRLIHQTKDSKWLKPCQFLDIRKVATEFAIAQDGEEFQEKVEDGYYNYSIEIRNSDNLSRLGIAKYLEKRNQGIRHVGRNRKYKPITEISTEPNINTPTNRAGMSRKSYQLLFNRLEGELVKVVRPGTNECYGLGFKRSGNITLKIWKDNEGDCFRDTNLFNGSKVPRTVEHISKLIDSLEKLSEIATNQEHKTYFSQLADYFVKLGINNV